VLFILQVRGLLQLFHDVEHTDRSNTFYEKFNTRYKAGEILRKWAASEIMFRYCTTVFIIAASLYLFTP
jgi:Ubiquitin elongating factor core